MNKPTEIHIRLAAGQEPEALFIETEDQDGHGLGGFEERQDGEYRIIVIKPSDFAGYDRPILPGDMVAHVFKPELDYREVISIGRDWLTLDILGYDETDRLPLDNYRTAIVRDGVL